MIIKKTCIMCPLSCQLEIKKVGKEIEVSGHNCFRGVEYAKSEMTNPVRSFTSLISTKFGVISVKTTSPISKSLIPKALKYIDTIKLNKKPQFNEVIESNFLNTGTDLIVTSDI